MTRCLAILDGCAVRAKKDRVIGAMVVSTRVSQGTPERLMLAMHLAQVVEKELALWDVNEKVIEAKKTLTREIIRRTMAEETVRASENALRERVTSLEPFRDLALIRELE